MAGGSGPACTDHLPSCVRWDDITTAPDSERTYTGENQASHSITAHLANYDPNEREEKEIEKKKRKKEGSVVPMECHVNRLGLTLVGLKQVDFRFLGGPLIAHPVLL